MPPHAKEDVGINPLFDAAKKLQVKRLKQLLMETITEDSVRARDSNGRTPLHFASGTASCQSAELLVEAGADLDCKDIDGYTPLHMAAGYGREDTVKFLIGKGANPLIEDNLGRTPRELAQEIISRGLPNQGGVKVPRGQMESVVKALQDAEEKWTQAGLPVSAPSPSESFPERSPGSALIAASSKGDLEAVKACVESLQNSKTKRKSSDVDTALSSASRNGHKATAAYLLEQGADVNAYDPDGATPLLAAADGGSAECVDLLMRNGAHVDAKDRVGVSALIAASYNGHVECVRSLLTHGADVNAQSHGGVTPLIAAAEGGSESCVRLLIGAGGDLEARTAEGKTALMHAVGQNITSAVEALIAARADLDGTDNEGRTALHHGARKQTAESLKLLLKAGADAARRCRRGRTPLEEAPPQSEAAAILCERWKQLEVEATQKQKQLLDELHASGPPPANEGCENGRLSRSARKKKGKKARRKRGAEEGVSQELAGVREPGSEGVREAGLESEQSGVTSVEATDGEDEPSTPVSFDDGPVLDPVSFPVAAESRTDPSASQSKENERATPAELETKRDVSETFGDVSPDTTAGAGDVSPCHVGTSEKPQDVTEGAVPVVAESQVSEPSADSAVEISSSSEGEWVTVTSHRARKQAGRAHVGSVAERGSAQKDTSAPLRKRGGGNPAAVRAQLGGLVGPRLDNRVQGSGDVAAFVSKIMSKQAALAQEGESEPLPREDLEGERNPEESEAEGKRGPKNLQGERKVQKLAEEKNVEELEVERKVLQREVERERKRLREVGTRLDEKSEELARRERQLSGKEVTGSEETLRRSPENPWNLPRGQEVQTVDNGVGETTRDGKVVEEPSRISGTGQAETAGDGRNGNTDSGKLSAQSSFELENGASQAANEQLRQALEQSAQELLLAREEIVHLMGVLAGLTSAHQEELRQQRLEAHASAMAAAAASWHAWAAQLKPLQNPTGLAKPASNPGVIGSARSKAVGSERSRSGGVLARTNSAGRPPPTLRSDQTAWAAALPPLPLSRSKHHSVSLDDVTEDRKPEWLREAAAAAAMAAASVMREKAFAQHWGKDRARALLQGEGIPLVGAPNAAAAVAPLSFGTQPAPESISGGSVTSSEWSSRPPTSEGRGALHPSDLDAFLESSSTGSEASFQGGPTSLPFSPSCKPPAVPLSPRGLLPASAPSGTVTLKANHVASIHASPVHVSPTSVVDFGNAGPAPSHSPVAMASEWVFDAALGRMVSTGKRPCPASPDELRAQPRLGLGATIARNRAYSSSNDLAALSRRSLFGPGSVSGAMDRTWGLHAAPLPLKESLPLASAMIQQRSPVAAQSTEALRISVEDEGLDNPSLKPGSRQGGLGFRTLFGMTRSASESHLSAFYSDSAMGGAILPFALKPPAGRAQGWFSLVPSPSEGLGPLMSLS